MLAVSGTFTPVLLCQLIGFCKWDRIDQEKSIAPQLGCSFIEMSSHHPQCPPPSPTVTPKSKHAHAHTPPLTSPCSASASLGWCNLGQTAMKLVLENKSGYIRPLCALHIQYPHRQPWDVSWPIENQLSLPNKEAVAKNSNEWKRGRKALTWQRDVGKKQSPGYLIVKSKPQFRNSVNHSVKWKCWCLSYSHTDQER